MSEGKGEDGDRKRAKLGLVVGDDNRSFLPEIERHAPCRYRVTHFEQHWSASHYLPWRINRVLFRYELGSFMRSCDVVFFEWASYLLCEATQLPKSCPVVVRLLGYELYEWAPKINWERVDLIIVLLEEVKLRFSERYPDHGHKCVVIPVGLDLTRYDPTPQPYRGHVGILGYITPRKRVYELILAFAEMLGAGLDLHLFIAGAYPESQEYDYAPIPRLPEKLGIADRVHIQGYVPDTAQWLKTIDVFVSNSYHETQHVALQEAMASGCYCLTHFWDGAEEFMPREYLFGTNRELVEKVAAFHRLPSEQKTHQQREMRRLVERFCDSRNVTPAVLNAIDGLLR